MEKTDIRCGTAVSVIGAVAFLVLLAINWPDESPDWAAWAGFIQAFGTVLAIWWTYRTTRDQFEAERQERETEREESKRLREAESARLLDMQMEVIRAIVIDALEALLEFQNYVAKLPNLDKFDKSPARLEDAQYALRSLLARDLPPGVAVHIVALQQSIGRCLRDCQQWFRREQEIDPAPTWYRCLQAFECAVRLDGVKEAWEHRQGQATLRAFFVHPETFNEIDPLDFRSLAVL